MEAQSTLFESEQGASLKWLPIERLHPHPNNPRIEYDAETVKGIAHTLKKTGHFDESHALLVRPNDDGFEIVSGHHRWQAAKRAQLEEVPCWVRQMDDKTAQMKLVTENNQSELSRLEVGLHALETVGRGQRGRGNSGDGLKSYAEEVGVSKQNINQWAKAAEVYKKSTRVDLLDHSVRALYEISKSPEHLWEPLVKEMIASDWSVRDTKHYRQKVEKFEVREPWERVFLPETAVVSAYLDTGEFSPQTVERLCDLAESTEQRIRSYDVEVESYLEEFWDWLHENSRTPGEGSWDPRQLKKYQREVQADLERAEEESRRMWAHGDWREHIDTLSGGEVRLVLTDPPYGIDYQSDYRLDRRKDRKHEPMDNDAGGAAVELRDATEQLYDRLAEDAHLLVFTHWQTEWDMRAALTEAGYEVRGSLIWVKNNTGMGDPETTFAPKHERIIHAVKGSPKLFEREPDVLEADRVSTERHPTEKPISLLKRLIRCTTVEGEKVADPFGGVASTLVAAREIDREVWGCEKSEDYHRIGQNRLST